MNSKSTVPISGKELGAFITIPARDWAASFHDDYGFGKNGASGPEGAIIHRRGATSDYLAFQDHSPAHPDESIRTLYAITPRVIGGNESRYLHWAAAGRSGSLSFAEKHDASLGHIFVWIVHDTPRTVRLALVTPDNLPLALEAGRVKISPSGRIGINVADLPGTYRDGVHSSSMQLP